MKQSLRTIHLAKCEKISINQKDIISEIICAQIISLKQYQMANTIGIYHAVKNEIDLHFLRLNAVQANKVCYFPVMNADHTLSFFPTHLETAFHKNRFNIMEPEIDHVKAVALEELDILFMPLVAFDERGTRIGMGGGYYDKTLALGKTPCLIGVAYDFQREEYIERDAWDIPLDIIITESKVYWSKL